MGLGVHVPAFSYCTDNAAMIAYAGEFYLKADQISGFQLEAVPNLPLSSFALV